MTKRLIKKRYNKKNSASLDDTVMLYLDYWSCREKKRKKNFIKRVENRIIEYVVNAIKTKFVLAVNYLEMYLYYIKDGYKIRINT